MTVNAGGKAYSPILSSTTQQRAMLQQVTMKQVSVTYITSAIALIAVTGWIFTLASQRSLSEESEKHEMSLGANFLPQSGLYTEINSNIDFDGYLKTVRKAEELWQHRRLTVEKFMEWADDPTTVIVDTRSPILYKEAHIKGAVNIDLSDKNSLWNNIEDSDTRIVIYDSNNFSNTWAWTSSGATTCLPAHMTGKPLDVLPPDVSVSISTFITLVGYGFTNVWVLGPTVDVSKDRRIPFDGTLIPSWAKVAANN